MGTAKKVVIAEDHKLFREGLKSMLSARHDLHVVDEAQDGLEAIRCVKLNKPNLHNASALTAYAIEKGLVTQKI